MGRMRRGQVMAKVTITFEDGKRGAVTVGVRFAPRLNAKKPTPAQCEAARLLHQIKNEHPEEFEAGLEDAE